MIPPPNTWFIGADGKEYSFYNEAAPVDEDVIRDMCNTFGYPSRLLTSKPNHTFTMTHREWLDNEYNQWIKALQECTVHNFKEHPVVRRMLSLDMEDNIFDKEPGLDLLQLQNVYLINKIGSVSLATEARTGPTIRFVHYAREILKRNPSSICEIGAGVGQFYATLLALGYKGQYCIEDLKEIRQFQVKYLEEVHKRTGLKLNWSKTMEPEEMLVSFYALGEFDDETKRSHQQLIDSSKRGYIAWNPHSGANDDLSIFDSHNITVTPGLEPGIKIIEW